MSLEMNLNNIRYFYYVAKHKSMSKASEVLYISVAALSNRIKNLEEDLGVTLFERKGNKLVLTSFGEVLFALTSEFSVRFNSLKEWIDFDEFILSTIKIGLSAYGGAGVLKKFYDKLSSYFTKIEIVYEESFEKLIHELEKGKIDCIISTSPKVSKGTTVFGVGSVRYYILAPKNFDEKEPFSILYPEMTSMGGESEIEKSLKKYKLKAEHIINIKLDYIHAYSSLLNGENNNIYVIPETIISDIHFKDKVRVIGHHRDAELNCVILKDNIPLKQIFNKVLEE